MDIESIKRMLPIIRWLDVNLASIGHQLSLLTSTRGSYKTGYLAVRRVLLIAEAMRKMQEQSSHPSRRSWITYQGTSATTSTIAIMVTEHLQIKKTDLVLWAGLNPGTFKNRESLTTKLDAIYKSLAKRTDSLSSEDGELKARLSILFSRAVLQSDQDGGLSEREQAVANFPIRALEDIVKERVALWTQTRCNQVNEIKYSD